MSHALTAAQLRILHDVRAKHPQPPPGHFPPNYKLDLELLVFLRLVRIEAGVLRLTDAGSDYLDRGDEDMPD